jgi:hypothetical protein
MAEILLGLLVVILYIIVGGTLCGMYRHSICSDGELDLFIVLLWPLCAAVIFLALTAKLSSDTTEWVLEKLKKR